MVGGVSAAEFEMRLQVQSNTPVETVGAEVIATIQAGARTGYDGGVDTLAYQVGPLQVWMLNGAAPAGAQAMKRDVRSGITEERWAVQVATPSNGLGAAVAVDTPVTVSWDPPSGGVCSGRSLALEDLQTGAVTNMAATNSYTFPAPGNGVPYDLSLVVGVAPLVEPVPPAAPAGLVSPLQGRRGVLLAWSPVDGIRYHVERIDNPLDGATRKVTRLTAAPSLETRWLDGQVVGNQVVAYQVIAVAGSGCESVPSAELLIAP
jgi:hypothetical protein